MTPAPRNPFSPGFLHADAHAAQSTPVPTSPDGIFQRYLLPLKKRATTTSDGSSADDSFVVPPKKRRVVDTVGEGTGSCAIPVQSRPRRSAACNVAYVSMEEDEAGTSAAGAKKNRNRNRNSNGNRKNGPQPARDAAPLVNRPLHLSEAQRQHLETLGATAPQFVIMKSLQMSDVDRNQNRLLFSCKREFLEGHPITGILAEKETRHVHHHRGLSVVVQDDHSNQFNFTLKYLDSNGGYRFIGTGWNDFVSKNKLVKDDLHFVIEVWAFRSPELPGQPKVPGIEGLQGHPDGALGFLLRLHHDESRDVHRGGEEEREFAPRPVKQKKRQAPAKAVRSKKQLAGAHVSQGEAVARDVTRAEIVEAVGEEMADALFGLLMLRSSAPDKNLTHDTQTVSHAYIDCAIPNGSQNFGS
ncbi:uncharacterized protein [Aegilops tauschii subsp. strangulata]|uniref:uncharacterized protein n=1 Tax=Aegilops tauschii subsp. strangulata TaxID=200361 RepID=UPI00098A66C1|nr:uncharacterized protein LOC109775240 [Aegilops tauschii subsp. strangulata]